MEGMEGSEMMGDKDFLERNGGNIVVGIFLALLLALFVPKAIAQDSTSFSWINPHLYTDGDSIPVEKTAEAKLDLYRSSDSSFVENLYNESWIPMGRDTAKVARPPLGDYYVVSTVSTWYDSIFYYVSGQSTPFMTVEGHVWSEPTYYSFSVVDSGDTTINIDTIFAEVPAGPASTIIVVDQGDTTDVDVYIQVDITNWIWNNETIPNPFYIEHNDGDSYLTSPLRVCDGDPSCALHGTVFYRFNVPRSGDYVIWGQTWAQDFTHDSFIFSIDASDIEDRKIWDIDGAYNVWKWMKVTRRDPDDGNIKIPRIFNLSKGDHLIRIDEREFYSSLKSIIVTNNMDFTP